VLSFLSNENCFAGHSREPCRPQFEHHCHKWRTFTPPWLTSPGPGPKPLDGSISLKFLLETRLQSKSFDTLDDLLRFRVQKLWSKVIKIFAEFPHIFKNHFPYFFNTKLNKFNSITCLNFAGLLITKLNFTHYKTLRKCFAFSNRYLTLWHPAGFGDFWQKQHLNACGFVDEYLRSCSI